MLEPALDPRLVHLVAPVGLVRGFERYQLPWPALTELVAAWGDEGDRGSDANGRESDANRREPDANDSDRDANDGYPVPASGGVRPWWQVCDDGGEDVEPYRLGDEELLSELEEVGRELARVTARQFALLAEAEARAVMGDRLGLSTAGWLVQRNTHSQRRAKAEVRLAVQVAAEPVLAEALAGGRVSVEQAERIARGMDRVPEEFSGEQRTAVVEQLVQFAGEYGPDALSVLVNRAVEVVAPEIAEEADRKALERLEREQQRDRHVSLRRDAEGAWLLSGKLPPAPGARLAAQLSALAAGFRSGDTTGQLTWGQAMADGLATLSGHYASCGEAPRHGADRPRVMLTVDLDTLRGELGAACLLDSDTPVTAQQARLLACDAGILPVVLSGRSEPLDVGREKRLFTGALRQAVILRDRGCVFPGCDRVPADCEVHHIKPWWTGGETSLANGVLLCEHHHHLVEPNPGAPPGSQWELHLDERGLPEFTVPLNPRHPERGRPTRQHHRHQATRPCVLARRE